MNNLLYSLKIVNTLYSSRSPAKSVQQSLLQWRLKFTSLGGFSHLLHTFAHLTLPSIDTTLTLKCIDNLIIILYEFFTQDKDLVKEVMALKEVIVDKCVHLIDLVGQYSIEQERKRGESYEEVLRRIQMNKQKKNKWKSYNVNNSGGGGKAKPEEEKED